MASPQAIDLLILCHCLSVEDCQAVLEAVDTIRPEMRRLIITAIRKFAPEAKQNRNSIPSMAQKLQNLFTRLPLQARVFTVQHNRIDCK
jgi:hypothetical protein